MKKLGNLFQIGKPKFKGPIKNLVLHWTSSTYSQVNFPDYHFVVNGAGVVYYSEIWEKGLWGSHVWRRNKGSIGISASCMLGATDKNYGKYPPTQEQINAMCLLTSQLLRSFQLPLEAVKVHAEFAKLDSYFPERWDWLYEGDLLKEKVKQFYITTKPIILGNNTK